MGYIGKTPTPQPLTASDIPDLAASKITSGTLADARFPATLPALNGSNLTNLDAADLTGTLPAISGANLTGISSDFVKLYQTSTENNPGASYYDYPGYFTDDYDHYRVYVQHVGSMSGQNFEIKLGAVGGSVDTGSNYEWSGYYGQTGSSTSLARHGSTSAGFIRFGWNGDASYKCICIFDIMNARNTGVYTQMMGQYWTKDGSGVWITGNSGGAWKNTAAVNILRIGYGNGNIQINNIAIYGIKT